MPAAQFVTAPLKINDWMIIHLPEDISRTLPSRGMVMIEGTLNGIRLQAPAEPDGKGSHWFKITDDVRSTANITEGEQVTLEIEASKEWPKPPVPEDIQKALSSVPAAHSLWNTITPKAQWEWIRWIRATSNTETRSRRIEVACSKLTKGMRRPCCFNSGMCTEPYISKNGILSEPVDAVKA
jgi:hypothetical protein